MRADNFLTANIVGNIIVTACSTNNITANFIDNIYT